MSSLSKPKVVLCNFQHILSFSKLRHKPFVKFSDTFHHNLANTLTSSARSVFIASPAAAHTKKFICWIDSGFSCVPFQKNYHKCSGTLTFRSDCIRVGKSLNHNRKMVWITDLDDPKVFSFVSLLMLEFFRVEKSIKSSVDLEARKTSIVSIIRKKIKSRE